MSCAVLQAQQCLGGFPVKKTLTLHVDRAPAGQHHHVRRRAGRARRLHRRPDGTARCRCAGGGGGGAGVGVTHHNCVEDTQTTSDSSALIHTLK